LISRIKILLEIYLNINEELQYKEIEKYNLSMIKVIVNNKNKYSQKPVFMAIARMTVMQL